MKILHTSDLHIGKIVNKFSMLEDQRYILWQIIDIAKREKPDAFIIAGDIYDRANPSAEAVALYDEFLYELSNTDMHIFIISGNHDSPERIAFASRLLAKNRIHISPVYDGTVEPVKLTDEHGEVCFYLLPFIKPVTVRPFFEDEKIESYTDAVAAAVRQMNIDKSVRNVLVAHQFITNAEYAGSEQLSVGGLDNVDSYAVEDFDYVALGHIHKPQAISKDHIIYSGSPLKYSFDKSDIDIQKCVYLTELNEKGNVSTKKEGLTPLHEMRVIEGKFEELMQKADLDPDKDDYIKVVLKDEQSIKDAANRLRFYYKNLMNISYDNQRTRNTEIRNFSGAKQKHKPIELVENFFEKLNDKELSKEQRELTEKYIEEIWGVSE